MEKSLVEQDRASEQVRCENNRFKADVEKLNKKIADYEPMQKELTKFVEVILFMFVYVYVLLMS